MKTTKGESIRLGGKTFELRPLKLGQLRKLLDALDGMAGKSGGELIDAAAEVLVAGLPDAGLTTDAVLDLEGTVDALNDAVAAVLRNAGMKPTKPGEALPQPGV